MRGVSAIPVEPTLPRTDHGAELGDAHMPSQPVPVSQIEAKPTPLFRFDPGWLFLLSGLAIIAAVSLIPAQHDLQQALWQRDRALAIEGHRLQRLERYAAYLAALRDNDQSVLISLAATQLNVSPVDRIPLEPMGEIARTSASVFPSLEPDPLKLPLKPPAEDDSQRHKLSILERLSINDSSRLWLIAAGMLCTLLGLLPATTRGRVASVSSAIAGSAAIAAEAAVREAGASVNELRSRRRGDGAPDAGGVEPESELVADVEDEALETAARADEMDADDLDADEIEGVSAPVRVKRT